MFDPENYITAAHLYYRLLGVVYFFAFFGFAFQIKGLIGENGILPVKEFLKGKRFRDYPTLFLFNCSDTALVATTLTGTVFSVFVVFNFYPILFLPLLFLLWMSIYTVGQEFLAFGWESLLLEMTYFAFFLSLTDVPNTMIWIALNLLIFRFHFLAGWIKWKHGDPNWRNLMASYYHYQSQPLPNTVAYYMHKLPLWFHKISTGVLFFCELVVPFAIFGPEELRWFAFCGLLGLQILIWGTGNFAFLNYMTVVMIFPLLSDTYLGSSKVAETSWMLDLPLSLIGIGLIFVQVVRIYHEFLPNRTFAKILRRVWPYFLAHSMAIFANLTTIRYEVIVEGSEDGQIWKEYDFMFKPTDITRRPKMVAPYQPRLDWLAWFLPFSDISYNIWFQNFLKRLLEGSPDVLSLMGVNPFPYKPPKYIRAQMYIYTFTHIDTKNESGKWWSRKYVKPYSKTYSLP